ncbi:hypothetical protein MTR67_047731 [Solanum verrucosum]|uniref:Uncharacterized protein n=1 Tax=Solanum verrucosum TaxID=315347 RepID=A0AAF0ZWR0_SOLVR|nr:hypothetical protein MTR67_047731 [Solanum verrucosum]
MRTAPQTPWVVFLFRQKSPPPPSSSSRLLRNPSPPARRLSSKPQVPLLPRRWKQARTK